MIIGSHQPYLFPYFGYWQLMNVVDTYVIADNLQYIKKGYINRNYILNNGTQHRFTLEVRGVHFATPINEIKVGYNSEKILKTIFHAYKKAPYFNEVYLLIENILLNEEKNLSKYIGHSIENIANYLEMDTKFIYESDLEIDYSQSPQSVIINICKILNSNHYINAIGGQELYKKKPFEKEGIVLNFLKTNEIKYKQFNDEFVQNLSIIDIMMFNSKYEIINMLEEYRLL